MAFRYVRSWCDQRKARQKNLFSKNNLLRTGYLWCQQCQPPTKRSVRVEGRLRALRSMAWVTRSPRESFGAHGLYSTPAHVGHAFTNFYPQAREENRVILRYSWIHSKIHKHIAISNNKDFNKRFSIQEKNLPNMYRASLRVLKPFLLNRHTKY